MPLIWSSSIDNLDWLELAALYRATPLGNKPPEALRTAFTNSMFKCFVYEEGKLVGVGLGKQIVSNLVSLSSGHKKIILYSILGKEPFYKKFGLKRMSTAMAIFENQGDALERGYVNET